MSSAGTPGPSSDGTIRRAFRDLVALAERWWARGAAAILTCGFAAASALLPDDAGRWERIGLAVGGVIGGALVVGTAAFVALVALTPLRQRDEARAELAHLKGASSDPAALATQFSAWMAEVRAARPTHSGAGLAMTFVMDKQAQDMARVEQAAAKQRYRERLDEAEQRARVDYHERWRDAVLAALSAGGSAPREGREPQTFKDLAVIEEALALAALPPPSRGPEAVRQLRAKLDEGYQLLTTDLVHPQGGDYKTDPLYRWGLATWRLLRSDFTEYARDFYGNHPQAGEGYFATAFFSETRPNRRAYLQTRVAQIEQVLRNQPTSRSHDH